MSGGDQQQIVLRLGSVFPNLRVKTTKGEFNLHEWKGQESWMLFFSHPRDFTPVCTTEMASIAQSAGEFEKRGVKLIGLSCDSVDSHTAWEKDVAHYAANRNSCELPSSSLPFPLIGDEDRSVAKALGMIDQEESNSAGLPLTCRAVFIVAPDNVLKLFMYYPATTGRNMVELLRVVDSLQLTHKRKVATPANWTVGEKVMIAPSASQEEATQMDSNYQQIQVPSGKAYLRMAEINK